MYPLHIEIAIVMTPIEEGEWFVIDLHIFLSRGIPTGQTSHDISQRELKERFPRDYKGTGARQRWLSVWTVQLVRTLIGVKGASLDGENDVYRVVVIMDKVCQGFLEQIHVYNSCIYILGKDYYNANFKDPVTPSHY